MISYLKKHVSIERHDSLIFMESLSMLYISKNNAHLYNKDSQKECFITGLTKRINGE